MASIRSYFSSHLDHSLNWIRKENRFAHRLAKRAAASGCFGFLDVNYVPAFVVNSDSPSA